MRSEIQRLMTRKLHQRYHRIVTVNSCCPGISVEETTKEMLAHLVTEDSELISLYYGEEVSEEEADRFTEELEEIYPDVDVDTHFGGQPIYYYVVSVE